MRHRALSGASACEARASHNRITIRQASGPVSTRKTGIGATAIPPVRTKNPRQIKARAKINPTDLNYPYTLCIASNGEHLGSLVHPEFEALQLSVK
jgi:hypothetical protein